MRTINRFLILTIILNLVILFGAGEGKVVFGFIELLAPSQFIKGYSKFSFSGTTDDKAFSSALIALVGQAILLITRFIKRNSIKLKLIYIGLFISIISFISLTISFSNFNDYIFWSGVPFLISSIFLLITTIKQSIRSLR